MDGHSDEDINKTPTKKQKQGKKTFQDEWLEFAEFKGWLYGVQNDNTKARCKACQVKSSVVNYFVELTFS